MCLDEFFNLEWILSLFLQIKELNEKCEIGLENQCTGYMIDLMIRSRIYFIPDNQMKIKNKPQQQNAVFLNIASLFMFILSQVNYYNKKSNLHG